MEHKTYKLSTVREIMDVATVDNMETLIADLGHSIRLMVAAKLIYPNWTCPYIMWTDDGKEGLTGLTIAREPEQ